MRSKYFMSMIRSTVSNDIIGLVRVEKSPQIKDAMSRCCGFKDFAEFTKNYPDKMLKGSNASKYIPSIYLVMDTSNDQFPLYDTDLVLNMGDLKRLFRKYNKSKINIITAPKMEDMKECEGFEETPKENLWFCSDYQTI